MLSEPRAVRMMSNPDPGVNCPWYRFSYFSICLTCVESMIGGGPASSWARAAEGPSPSTSSNEPPHRQTLLMMRVISSSPLKVPWPDDATRRDPSRPDAAQGLAPEPGQPLTPRSSLRAARVQRGFGAYGLPPTAFETSAIVFCALTMLPAASSGGEITAMPNLPGETAMMPPPTPLLPGSPVMNSHLPESS